MKHVEPWHTTPIGRVVRFLGSLQLAVPVLFFVAAALAWGTYIESTQNVKVARAMVYGSWWFLGLMGLVCVSLVFAVVVRYPWKRRHVGFMTVHASLVALIFGGFWSLFSRIEGHLLLEEGMTDSAIELEEEVLELQEVQAGKFSSRGTIPAPDAPGTVTVGSKPIELVAKWPNIREEQFGANDGPEPFRAIEVAIDADAPAGDWIGEESKSGGMSALRGLRIRVLADGATWEPPAPQPAVEPGFVFVVGEDRRPLGAEGDEAVPGWKIASVRRFDRATVSGGGLTENASGDSNPAVDVVITDGKGSSERHTAFLNFPEMVLARAVEGTAKSGARLTSTRAADSGESFVVFGPVSSPKYGYTGPDGASRILESPPTLPASFNLGDRQVKVLRQVARARTATRFVEAPLASERRPAWVVRVPGSAETIVVPWKGPTPVPALGATTLLRFGPRTVPLPFSVKLNDFRKSDYPGTEMAMAYESDVVISKPGQPELPYRIFMNNPYASAPWKVYQSGFMGENVSVFSVMKDPGLPLTYIASAGLCIGIFLTFYSRSLSWGHPGIPIEFDQKEPVHGTSRPSTPLTSPLDHPAHVGV